MKEEDIERYKKALCECDICKGTVQPFMQRLSQEHDWGTGFYEDITILSGPGGEYNFFQQRYPELYNLWRTPRTIDDTKDVAVYSSKHGGTFVLEYEKYFEPNDVRKVLPKWRMINSFMLYKDKEYSVPSLVGEAVKNLYPNQEYCSVVLYNHHDEINPDGSLKIGDKVSSQVRGR